MCNLKGSPIIVSGMQRSGTTAIAYSLRNYFPDFTNESSFFKYLWFEHTDEIKGHVKSQFQTKYGIDLKDTFVRFNPECTDLDDFRRKIVQYAHTLVKNLRLNEYKFIIDAETWKTNILNFDQQLNKWAGVWGDKLTNSGSIIPEIRRIYPESKVIYVIREGRKVVASNMRLGWYDEKKAWEEWINEVNAYHRWSGYLDHLLIKQEDMLNNRDEVTAKIGKYLGYKFKAIHFSGFIHMGKEEPKQEETDWTKYCTQVPAEAQEILERYGWL